MSLREIARKAGVSAATVSRVLNDVDRQKVSEATRLKVLAIARSMRYQPNPQAVSLVTRRPPNAVGLVIPYNSHVFESFYFTEIIRGAVDATNTGGMNITLFVPRKDAPRDEFHDTLISTGHVSGALLIGTRLDDPSIPAFQEMRLPFVVVNSNFDLPGVSCVDCDNIIGACDAVRHLIRLGHRRIAFISGPDTSSNARDRSVGYRRALDESGIPFDPEIVRDGAFEETGGREAMKSLLALPELPTAVFASNDVMAIGALRAIKKEGLTVPDDIAIVGFDDIPMAQHLEPALTTVHQPIYLVGRRAAETLLAQIHESRSEEITAATHLLLRTRLVIRESCGARRAEVNS